MPPEFSLKLLIAFENNFHFRISKQYEHEKCEGNKTYLVALRILTYGFGESSRCTHSGSRLWNASADSLGRVKQQGPIEGPRMTIMSSKLESYSAIIAFTVALAIPNKVPFQPR